MSRFSFFKSIVMIAAAAGLAACSDDGNEPIPSPGPDPFAPVNSLFVVNEGGFMQSNGSLSLYNTETSTITNDIFRKANGFGPGDVVQSMTIGDSPYAWLVVNNSQVIFAIDIDTFEERGRIAGDLVSPRHMLIVNENKAYVSQFYTDNIAVVNPKTFSITGHINYPIAEGASASTGEMVRVGDYVYTCCPNYNNAVLKVDTSSDKVVDVCYPGIQPSHIVADANDHLWVLCDGGYEGSPYGYEAPRLALISTIDFEVKKEFTMNIGDYVSALAINKAGDRLYWINGGVYAMNISDSLLPNSPIIEPDGFFYGVTVDPTNDEIYVADAVDFAQPGRLLRYSKDGSQLLSTVTTGVCPHAFCWKKY